MIIISAINVCQTTRHIQWCIIGLPSSTQPWRCASSVLRHPTRCKYALATVALLDPSCRTRNCCGSALCIMIVASSLHLVRVGVRHGSHCRSAGMRHTSLEWDETMLDRDGCVECRWFQSLWSHLRARGARVKLPRIACTAACSAGVPLVAVLLGSTELWVCLVGCWWCP